MHATLPKLLGEQVNSELEDLGEVRREIEMKYLTFEADERPGLMGDVSFVFARSKVIVESMDIVGEMGKVIIKIGVRDDRRALEVIRNNGFKILGSEPKIAQVVALARS
jgi:hypothetical protein